jgi:hypothetical protein
MLVRTGEGFSRTEDKVSGVRIEGLRIEGFRGISKAELTDLGDINLLVGENGSGKSTVLEALFLLSGVIWGPTSLSSPEWNRFWPQGKFHWLAGRRNEDQPQVLDYSGKPFSVRFPVLSEEQRWGRQAAVGVSLSLRLRLTSQPDSLGPWRKLAFGPKPTAAEDWNAMAADMMEQVKSLVVSKPGQVLLLPPLLSFLDRAFFVDTAFTSRTDVESTLWDSMLGTNRKRELLDRFNECFGMELEDANYSPGTRRIIVAQKGATYGLPLDSLGAGMRMGFRLFLVSLLLKDTILLVEEFDAFQHPSSLKNLLKALVQICEQNNLQLFMTTHRAETVRLLLDVAQGKPLAGRVVPTMRDSQGVVTARSVPFDDALQLFSSGYDFRDFAEFMGEGAKE